MKTVSVCKDDLELVLDGLYEYWITKLPEYKPAIERLRKEIGMPEPRNTKFIWQEYPE